MEEEEEEPAESSAIPMPAESSLATGPLAFPLRPGTDELLRFTLAIAMARGTKAVTNLDVTLASLVRFDLTALDKAELETGATSALIQLLPEPREERITDALSAAGVDPSELRKFPASVSSGDSRLAALVTNANELAGRLGRHEVWSHHVVALALAGDPLPDAVLHPLRVSQSLMRATLRSSIARRWPEESPEVWDSVLGQQPAQVHEGTAVPWSKDAPARIDALRRGDLADVIAGRLQQMRESDPELSFLVHIDGSWGTGKSSLLNFLNDRLADSFLVIPFNAWQQSRVGPPWWTLLTTTRRRIAHHRCRGGKILLRISETRARMKQTAALYSLALLILVVVIAVVAYALWPHRSTTASWSSIAKAVTTIAGAVAVLWAGSRVAAQFLLWDSAGGARLFEKSSVSPMPQISNQFSWLINQSTRPVIFFIDDLDRCDDTYVVDFLDSVQTIVRDTDTTRPNDRAAIFVVAADGAWLRTSYEAKYPGFRDAIYQPGRPLGYFFLDKIFQLSIPMPVPPQAAQQALFRHLVQLPPQDNAAIAAEVTTARRELNDARGDGERVRGVLRNLPSPVAQAVSGDAALILMDPGTLSQTKNRLEKFANLLDGNPRTTKRFLNTFSIYEAIRTIETDFIDFDTLALWAIIRVRWPEVADYLQQDPTAVAYMTESQTSTPVPERLKATAFLPELRKVVRHPEGGPLTAELVSRCSGSTAAGIRPA